jgi:hypothetical protein
VTAVALACMDDSPTMDGDLASLQGLDF